MKDNVCVSVIFATYNRESLIEQIISAWREVDKVTKYSYEIICSDDDSSDDTVKLLQNAEGLPITILENTHGGAGKARNAALKAAKGEIVIFTGDDIFPIPDFINKHYESYLKFGDKVATLGQLVWHPDIRLNHLMNHITCIGCEQFSFYGLPSYQFIDFRHFYTSNISVAKSELDKLDQHFDHSFDKYGFEDIELGYRLEKNGVRIFYDPSILASHHHVYDSVEKFCKRQYSAGDQLVVFNNLHNDLKERLGIDVNEIHRLLGNFIDDNKSTSFSGLFIKAGLRIAKYITRLLERMMKKSNNSMLKYVCSILYSRIFNFYIYLGCVIRLLKDDNIKVNSNVAYKFVSKYTNQLLQRNYHQIFFDTGYGFNENSTTKISYIDLKHVTIKADVPKNTKQIRFDALAKPCVVKLLNAYVSAEDGRQEKLIMHYTNAGKVLNNTYNFKNTIDPQMFFDEISNPFKTVNFELEICKLKNENILKLIYRKLAKLRRKMIESRKQITQVDAWNFEYSLLQPRRIQLCIGGNADDKAEYIDQYKEKLALFGDDIIVLDINDRKEGYINYCYLPVEEYLHPLQMSQVVYTLLNFNYDYIIVSNGLSDYPELSAKSLADAMIYLSVLGDDIQKINLRAAKGRIMRLPVSKDNKNKLNLSETFSNIKIKNETKLINSGDIELQLNKRIYQYQKKKPLIFVFPIFMAVGGVERNTIEMMRELQKDYSFCVFTMERHNQLQGSLHYQLLDLCDYIFDLREISEFDHYLPLLNDFNDMFHPDMIWLCNNSPWFEANSLVLRKIFDQIPIIVQDAYDTNVGWIEYYNTPGVQSFDRYIAINQKIRDVFISKYNIASNKIDVIYSAIDGTKVKDQKTANTRKEILEKKYQLQSGKKHFAYIGRLTEQKNPIRYLKLIKSCISTYPDAEFVMVGDGILKPEVDQYILDNNLENAVIRIPYVDNTPELISVLDGLILTSDYEGLAIVSIEAMSIGVPIFSTNTGDLELFLKKTNGGHIVDESISDSKNWDIFYSNLDDYKESAKKASDEILSFFSASTIGKQYRDVFTRAIDNRREG